MIIDCIELI